MNTQAKPNRLQKVISLAVLIALVMSLGLAARPAAQPVASFIVQGSTVSQVSALVRAYGGSVTGELSLIDGVSALLTAEAASRLRQAAGISSVFPDQAVQAVDKGAGSATSKTLASDYPDVVGADVVWQKGVTGKGVTVAVVDSGVEISQTGLDRGTGKKNDSRVLAFVDFVENKRTPTDPSGHGTHVTGVIANARLGADGEWMGVAPDVNLVIVRVLAADGSSTYSRVIRGIQWVVEHQDEYDIRVLNLSLVAPALVPYWADPLDRAVEKAWLKGIVVVVAAGNSGPDPMTISVPGNTPYVITVGAFTDNYTPNDWSDDYIAPFSAAGPTFDAFAKPDVVAPGGHIVSTMQPSSYLARKYADNKVAAGYYSMAGTSQAAAVVTGVAALTVAANPALSPDEVKFRLMYTAFPWVNPQTGDALYSVWQQGAGRVSAPDAVFQPISGSANAGMDLLADLHGDTHYQGYTIFDPATGTFRLTNGLEGWANGYGQWDGHMGNWAGAMGNWAGYTTWYAAMGNWAGAMGNWAGAMGNWAGAMGNWAGAMGNWAGAMGNWAGAMGNWAGTMGNWTGAMGNWAGAMGNWAGAMGNWAGAMGNWAGAVGNWAGAVGNWAGAVGNWAGSLDFTGSVSDSVWSEPAP